MHSLFFFFWEWGGECKKKSFSLFQIALQSLEFFLQTFWLANWCAWWCSQVSQLHTLFVVFCPSTGYITWTGSGWDCCFSLLWCVSIMISNCYENGKHKSNIQMPLKWIYLATQSSRTGSFNLILHWKKPLLLLINCKEIHMGSFEVEIHVALQSILVREALLPIVATPVAPMSCTAACFLRTASNPENFWTCWEGRSRLI